LSKRVGGIGILTKPKPKNRKNTMQTITTKFLPATDHKDGRIKAINSFGTSSVTLSWDDSLNVEQNHILAAQALAKKLGWAGKFVGGGTKDGFVFCFSDSRITFEVEAAQ